MAYRYARVQDKLISGENIKTINGESILGEGNIEVAAASGGAEPIYSLAINLDTDVSTDNSDLVEGMFHFTPEMTAQIDELIEVIRSEECHYFMTTINCDNPLMPTRILCPGVYSLQNDTDFIQASTTFEQDLAAFLIIRMEALGTALMGVGDFATNAVGAGIGVVITIEVY